MAERRADRGAWRGAVGKVCASRCLPESARYAWASAVSVLRPCGVVGAHRPARRFPSEHRALTRGVVAGSAHYAWSSTGRGGGHVEAGRRPCADPIHSIAGGWSADYAWTAADRVAPRRGVVGRLCVDSRWRSACYAWRGGEEACRDVRPPATAHPGARRAGRLGQVTGVPRSGWRRQSASYACFHGTRRPGAHQSARARRRSRQPGRGRHLMRRTVTSSGGCREGLTAVPVIEAPLLGAALFGGPGVVELGATFEASPQCGDALADDAGRLPPVGCARAALVGSVWTSCRWPARPAGGPHLMRGDLIPVRGRHVMRV